MRIKDILESDQQLKRLERTEWIAGVPKPFSTKEMRFVINPTPTIMMKLFDNSDKIVRVIADKAGNIAAGNGMTTNHFHMWNVLADQGHVTDDEDMYQEWILAIDPKLKTAYQFRNVPIRVTRYIEKSGWPTGKPVRPSPNQWPLGLKRALGYKSTVIESPERYRGIIEPGSRSRFDQLITISKPIRAYHATHEGMGKILTNRDVKTYDSMGTWLTSNRNMASKMYGPHVGTYEIPSGRYLLARRNQDMWELILNCLPLIDKNIGKDEADHLRRYPLTGKNIAFMNNLRKMARDERSRMGSHAASQSIEGMIVELLRWKDRDKLDFYRGLLKSQEIYRKVCGNADYCRDYRALMDHAGIQGIIWNGRNWDNSPERQTVFLVFHTGDLKPLQETVMNESADAPLYHGTTFDNAMSILQKGAFVARTSHMINDKPVYGLSTTRSPRMTHVDHNDPNGSHQYNPNYIEPFNVIFILSQRHIKQKYRIIPIDFFNARKGKRSESEEFIIIDKFGTLPLKGNVSKIIYLPGSYPNPGDEPPLADFHQLQRRALPLGIPVIYKDWTYDYSKHKRDQWNRDTRNSLITHHEKNETNLNYSFDIKKIQPLFDKYIKSEIKDDQTVANMFTKEQHALLWQLWLNLNARPMRPITTPITANIMAKMTKLIAQRYRNIVYTRIAPFKPKIKENAQNDRFAGSRFADDEGNEYSVERLYQWAKGHNTLRTNFPISRLEHDLTWWEK